VSAGLEAIRVVAVDAAAGRPLRLAVLRPLDPPDRPMYPSEEDAATLHFAALGADGEVLSVGSLMPDPHPRHPSPNDWRIRGMATRPHLRGRGLGSLVLEAIEGTARERGGSRLWCNARVGARDFYEHAGFAAEGVEFEIEGIGGHFLMSKPLL
jgi:GNAT superfamily N-acetyltransferase